MIRASALLFCAILVGLSLLQISLVFGAPFGHYAWGGQNEVLPLPFRIGSIVSLGIYTLFAVLILQKAGIIKLIRNQKFVTVGAWVVFGYSCLGILANAASRSHAERNVMTPIVIIMALLSFMVARSKA